MDFTTDDIKSICDELVKVVRQVVREESSHSLQCGEATVVSVNSDGSLVVRLISSPSDESQDFTIANTTGGAVTVGQRVWINYWSDYTNAYVAPSIKMFPSVVIPVSAFQDDTTYAEYPYKANVGVPGMSANATIFVLFDQDDVSIGILAPTAESESNSISVWSKKMPDNAVTITAIMTFESL